MATYVIGDIQGCFLTLERLLETFAFDRDRDRLWLVGDLVNRGPRSLEVLRWAAGLGEGHAAVIGNHDLHLLAVAEGVRRERRGDTLAPILEARDRRALLGWLRARPFFYREGNLALVHAGLVPGWTADEAEGWSDRAREALRESTGEFLTYHFDGPPADRWRDDLDLRRGIAVAVNAFTRVRVVDDDGRFHLDHKGSPADAPTGCRPWFEPWEEQDRSDLTVFFGHWAALGLSVRPRTVGLDSGCVWGNRLSAIRIEDRQVFSVSYSD